MKRTVKKSKLIYKCCWVVTLIATLVICGISGCSDIENDEQVPSSETEKPQNEDLATITTKGHPIYYGSTEKAHEVWDDVGGEKVIFPDSYDSYSDETIIFMDGYSSEEDDPIIRDIQIYFQNFSTPLKISLNKALKIADGYLPYDIISKWYEFGESYCLKPKDSGSTDATYYVVTYHLTDAGSTAFYAKEHSYSGTIDIIFEVAPNDTVNYFTIGFGTPRWMSSLGTSDYSVIDWHHDFCEKHKK